MKKLIALFLVLCLSLISFAANADVKGVVALKHSRKHSITTATKKQEAVKPKTKKTKQVLKKINAEIMTLRYRRMNQNADVVRGKKIHLGDWLYMGGLVNLDTSYWSKPNFGVGTHDTSSKAYLSFSNVNLNFDAKLNPWMTAHLGLLYANGGISPEVRNFRPTKNVVRNVGVEEGYLDIHNFSKSPLFFRAGEMYLPFGRYQLYPLRQSLTQILSQTNLPTVQIGFVTQMGLEGSVFVMDGSTELNKTDQVQVTDYGVNLGFADYNKPSSYDVGVGYLDNMADVDAVREVVDHHDGYKHNVPAISVYGDLYMGPFSYDVRYITALTRFNSRDFQYTDRSKKEGAEPSAVNIGAGFNFQTFKHHSRLNLGYEWTYEANNTAIGVPVDDATHLPKNRWLVGYAVNLVKHLMMQITFYQDRDYPRKNGGTDRHDNVTMARFSYIF